MPKAVLDKLCGSAFTTKDKAFSYALEDLEEKTDLVRMVRSQRELDIALSFLLTKKQRAVIKAHARKVTINPDSTMDSFSERKMRDLTEMGDHFSQFSLPVNDSITMERNEDESKPVRWRTSIAQREEAPTFQFLQGRDAHGKSNIDKLQADMQADKADGKTGAIRLGELGQQLSEKQDDEDEGDDNSFYSNSFQI